MELRDWLYFVRQYRQYDAAGIVPHVRCDECDTPYYPRVDDDVVYLWCYHDDVWVDPGLGLLTKMKEYVERIEG